MKLRVLAAAAAALAISGGAASAQQQSGVNVGSLTCNVAGGVGFVFGSTKQLNCLFSGTDGRAERYVGTVNKYGVDIGFTRESHIVWLVFAPGRVGSGALSGTYAGATAGVAAGVGVGANVLIGGSGKQISLQPVSVEGTRGVNIAAGIGEVVLRPAQ